MNPNWSGPGAFLFEEELMALFISILERAGQSQAFFLYSVVALLASLADFWGLLLGIVRGSYYVAGIGKSVIRKAIAFS